MKKCQVKMGSDFESKPLYIRQKPRSEIQGGSACWKLSNCNWVHEFIFII